MTASNIKYLCDCWHEAFAFIKDANSEEWKLTGGLGDVLVETLIFAPKANKIVWRFLKNHASFYLSDAGEPIALANTWLNIPTENLEASGNNMFILKTGILGQGEQTLHRSEYTDFTNVLGIAKNRQIVVNSPDWHVFLSKQPSNPDYDHKSLEGRAHIIVSMLDQRKFLKKDDAKVFFRKLGITDYQTNKAWGLAAKKRPEIKRPGRKVGSTK